MLGAKSLLHGVSDDGGGKDIKPLPGLVSPLEHQAKSTKSNPPFEEKVR